MYKDTDLSHVYIITFAGHPSPSLYLSQSSSSSSQSHDLHITSSLRFAKLKHHLSLSPIITYYIYYTTDASLAQYLLHFYFTSDMRCNHVTIMRLHRIIAPKARFQALTQELGPNSHHVTMHNARCARTYGNPIRVPLLHIWQPRLRSLVTHMVTPSAFPCCTYSNPICAPLSHIQYPHPRLTITHISCQIS